MVSNGIESTVLKAKYGSDIRKSQLHHTQDLNFNDLVLMMQRYFHIKSSTTIGLKYRDSEGDWITLANDDDVVFALQNEPSLYVEVFAGENGSRPLSPLTDSLVTNNSLHNSIKEELLVEQQQQSRHSTPQRQAAQQVEQQQHFAPVGNEHSSFASQPQQQPQQQPQAPPQQQQQQQESVFQAELPPAPQRPPSIQSSVGGGQLGACTPPVPQDFQHFSPGYQPQQQQPNQQHQQTAPFSHGNDYSAPPTIQPSVHKEVVVSSAYQPFQQQQMGQAPPPAHQHQQQNFAPALPPGQQANAPPAGQPPYSAGYPPNNYQQQQQPQQQQMHHQQMHQPMAPPSASQPMQQPAFGPPPVSSVVGNAGIGGNPFSRGPAPGGQRPAANAQGNYY